MFRFAYANMNSVSAAAANCAEAASSCAANACANNAVNMLMMDAALAASISISIISIRLGLIDLRVLYLVGIIILARAALGKETQA